MGLKRGWRMRTNAEVITRLLMSAGIYSLNQLEQTREPPRIMLDPKPEIGDRRG